MRWVVGSILHGMDPLSYVSFQPVIHDWCNKGRGMYSPVYGMVHIKEPLLLIGKNIPCGGSGFPLSLSEWPFTICPISKSFPSFLQVGWACSAPQPKSAQGPCQLSFFILDEFKEILYILFMSNYSVKAHGETTTKQIYW